MYITKGQDIITKSQYIIEEIGKINPDILLLQEASNYFLNELESKLGYKNQCQTLTHGGLCVILTKPGLSIDNPKVYKQTGVSIDINHITVANCHLVPYFQNQKFRETQLHTIIDNSNQNIVVMGDMNMNNTQSFDHNDIKDIAIEYNNMADTWFLSYHKKNKTTSHRFDRIYSNTKCTNYQVYADFKYLSDHVPISVQIQL